MKCFFSSFLALELIKSFLQNINENMFCKGSALSYIVKLIAAFAGFQKKISHK